MNRDGPDRDPYPAIGKLYMIKNLLGDDDGPNGETSVTKPVNSGKDRQMLSLFADDDPGVSEKEPFILSRAEPESFAETTRKSGLAWSAGIAFFASVVFMLILGWGADLLFGTSPWGMVAGIVLGSLIGFIQFFRLTSQIFK